MKPHFLLSQWLNLHNGVTESRVVDSHVSGMQQAVRCSS